MIHNYIAAVPVISWGACVIVMALGGLLGRELRGFTFYSL